MNSKNSKKFPLYIFFVLIIVIVIIVIIAIKNGGKQTNTQNVAFDANKMVQSAPIETMDVSKIY